MATLNTLRTRFGVVLSAVIAFALLAFIFSLKAEMGFSGNDPIIAQIDGQNVTYTEYQRVYDDILSQSGVTEVNEQQADMLYTSTWQSLVSQYVLLPGFEKLGLSISPAERMSIIRGEIPTQAMYSAFADPATGIYNVQAVNSFLLTSQGNPEADAMWTSLIKQACDERMAMKYIALIGTGTTVNKYEVERGVESANKSYSGRWASKRYSDVADSLFTVSSEEIKRYYDAHKAAYKRLPTRTISYVEFNVDPSTQDKADIESKARSLGADFEKASDIRAFLRENRSGTIAQNFVSAAALPVAQSEALVAGKQYGPVSDGSKWTISRVADSVYASDTLTISHIVLSYTDADLADSLLVALRKGGDDKFIEAASTYSVYAQSAQYGGEIGPMPFSAFADEFASALAPARKGDIVKVEAGDMIQLIKVDDATPRKKQYKVATIELPIIPSQATRTTAHNAAGIFAVDAKGGVDKFKSVASESSLAPHNADLTTATRTIPAVAGSQEVVRWAQKANVGDISEIFKVDGGYVVAMLVGTNDNEFRTYSEVESTIKRSLLNKKKFEKMSSELSGSTFDAQVASLDVEASEFTDAKYDAYYVAGIGVEPRVIGAITTTESTDVVSAPVEGNVGIYIYVVDQITESDEPQTAEAEAVRAKSMAQQMLQQQLYGALESMAKVKDLRGAVL